LAGAVSLTTSGVFKGTPEILVTILALIPPAPPFGDPQLVPIVGKRWCERIMRANSAMWRIADAINQPSILSCG
jgi:hypothetical protein